MSAVQNLPHPRVRPMIDADLLQVMGNEEASYEFPWTLGIFRDCLRVGYHCYVCEIPSQLVGHGVMSVAVGECHLLNICVHPDWQRRGFGRHIVEFLLDVARQRGVRMAALEVRVSNTIAHKLYIDLGFNEVGTRKGYYPGRNGREDAIILARDL